MKKVIKCGNCGEKIEINDEVFQEESTYTVECSCCSCDVNVEAVYDEDDEDKIIELFVY